MIKLLHIVLPIVTFPIVWIDAARRWWIRVVAMRELHTSMEKSLEEAKKTSEKEVIKELYKVDENSAKRYERIAAMDDEEVIRSITNRYNNGII